MCLANFKTLLVTTVTEIKLYFKDFSWKDTKSGTHNSGNHRFSQPILLDVF